MKTVGPKDFYEVKRMNQISDLEWGYASDFYLPLLGPVPFAVYRMLYDDESANNGNASTHDKLFRKAQVSSGEFYHALECLEALALVKTYVNDEGGLHYFVYALYAPKQPKSFFKDVLLVGTLKKYIGEDAVKKLREKYKAPKVLPVFKDVSTTFSAVYHPDFNDPVYGTNPSDSDVVGGELAINTDFNLPAFLANLANYGIKGESLNSDEKASIAKYGILYSITPKAMAEIIANRYDGNAKYGERVDFKKVESDCLDTMEFKYLRGEREDSQVSGDSALAAKIVFLCIQLAMDIGLCIGLSFTNKYFQKSILDYPDIPSPNEVALIATICELVIGVLGNASALMFYFYVIVDTGTALSFAAILLFLLAMSSINILVNSALLSWLLIFSRRFGVTSRNNGGEQ